MRRQWLKVMALCAGGMAGCSSLQEAKQDYLISYRNEQMAKEAWRSMRGEYNNMYPTDFERGWRQGYYDVASGGSGCSPAIPPSNYWHIRYQNSCGQQRVLSWLNGYREGALVAEQDGVAAFSAIPTFIQANNCNKDGTKLARKGPPPVEPTGRPAPRPIPPGRDEMAPLPVRPRNSTPNAIPPVDLPNKAGPPPAPPEKKLLPALPNAGVNSAIPPIAKAAGSITSSGLTTAVPLYGKSETKS